MRIYLNLLPEEKKEEVAKKRGFLKVIRNEFLFSVSIVSFFSILFVMNICLRIKAQSIDDVFNLDNSQKEYKELESYEQQFKDINSKIMNISRIESSHLNWVNVFYKISNVVPDDVYISDLATADYGISMAGKAKTRDNFLKFQENIKNENCFSDVEVPLSSLVSKENVEFQINFKVKDDCLKNKRL